MEGVNISIRAETPDLQDERRLADSNRWSRPQTLGCLKPLRKAGKAAYTESEDGCWLWNGTLNSRGYPVRGTKDGRYLVHRRVFEEMTGLEIPEGIQIHHLCETRRCVNPVHLRALDQVSHSREHLGGPSLREQTVSFVRENGPSSLREIAAGLGQRTTLISTMAARAATRGELQRVSRGVYRIAEAS